MPLDGTNYEQHQQDAVLDVLRRGRERVANGWCQGVLWDSSGRVCALGALRDSGRLELVALKDLSKEIPDEYKIRHDLHGENVVYYNNATDRTQVEIVALFDRAIARREAALISQEA